MRTQSGPSRLKPLATMLALTSCVILTGCAKTTASGGTECARWSPIYWSKADTDGTIRQVKEHNAVYKRLCGGAQ